MLRVSTDTVCRWVQEGKLAYSRPGRRLLIGRQSVEKYIAQAQGEPVTFSPDVRRVRNLMGYARRRAAHAQQQPLTAQH